VYWIKDCTAARSRECGKEEELRTHILVIAAGDLRLLVPLKEIEVKQRNINPLTSHFSHQEAEFAPVLESRDAQVR
jgi:hypothetical protein